VVQKHLHILGIIVHKYPECLRPEETSLLRRIYLSQLEMQVNLYVLVYRCDLFQVGHMLSEKIHMKGQVVKLNFMSMKTFTVIKTWYLI
jgi:hypothetical protein